MFWSGLIRHVQDIFNKIWLKHQSIGVGNKHVKNPIVSLRKSGLIINNQIPEWGWGDFKGLIP